MVTTTTSTANLGITPGGLALAIHFTKLESSTPGPHVYIQSGIHGGELTYWVLKRLFTYYSQADDWSGSLTLVGVANPIAWSQRVYYSTNGKFDFYDGRDWNRNFPGDHAGSLSQRIAASLFSVAKTADLAVDLHTSRKSPPFNISCDARSLELAKQNGIPFTYHVELSDRAKQKYKGTFLLTLKKAGVTNLTIECGAHDSYEEASIDQVVNALRNIMATLGMTTVPNAKKSLRKTRIFSEYITYFAPDGGYIEPLVAPGTEYMVGDLLYRLHHPVDFSSQDIAAQENGIAMKLTPTHIVHPGDEVFQCVATDA